MGRRENGRSDFERANPPPLTRMLSPMNGRNDLEPNVFSPSKEKHDAFCDFCKKNVDGIRYKCVTMPDFDLCEKCYPPNRTDKGAGNYLDPKHIFYAIDYKTVDDRRGPLGNRTNVVHEGFECTICDDGKDIVGVRYLCVQSGINLCESCEFSQKHDPTEVRMKHTIPQPSVKSKRNVREEYPIATLQPARERIPLQEAIFTRTEKLAKMMEFENGRVEFERAEVSAPPGTFMMLELNGREDHKPMAFGMASAINGRNDYMNNAPAPSFSFGASPPSSSSS